MKLLGLITAFLFVCSANAADGNHIRGILGFSSSALNIGVDYENRSGDIGAGGYFFLGGEEKVAGQPEVLAIGGNVTLHLYNQNNFHIYMAPGFGFAKMEMGGNDETTFGPTLKAGIEYAINSKISAGLQHFYVYNWMSDEAFSNISYLNAAATFAF